MAKEGVVQRKKFITSLPTLSPTATFAASTITSITPQQQ